MNKHKQGFVRQILLIAVALFFLVYFKDDIIRFFQNANATHGGSKASGSETVNFFATLWGSYLKPLIMFIWSAIKPIWDATFQKLFDFFMGQIHNVFKSSIPAIHS